LLAVKLLADNDLEAICVDLAGIFARIDRRASGGKYFGRNRPFARTFGKINPIGAKKSKYRRVAARLQPPAPPGGGSTKRLSW
jgi:hypothetical protein